MENNNENLELETILFKDENGEEVEFAILDATTLNGMEYLLVTEAENINDETDEESLEVMIMKEVAEESNDDETTFETVEDEEEAKAVLNVFKEQLSEEGVDFE